MSLYSYDEILEIAKDLKISNDKVLILKATLEGAAHNYFYAEQRRDEKLTDGEEKDKFGKIADYLSKAIKLYDDLAQSQGSMAKFYEGMAISSNLYPEEYSIIVSKAYKDKKLNPKFIHSILNILQNSARSAENDSNIIFSKMTKTQLAIRWLQSIIPFWTIHAKKITLSEGRHDEDLGHYDSPAMRILIKMAKPIGVSPSIIAEAIKDYRRSEKEKSKFLS